MKGTPFKLKQKLSPKASAAKKKRAENQRKRRSAIKAGKNISGMDYDHKDKKFKPVSENRAGTRNE